MPDVYYVNKENSSKKEKAKNFFANKFEKFKDDAKDFYSDHEDEIKFFAPIVASMTVATAKVISSNKKHKDEKSHETRVYDRSEGHYWYLKKKPTNYQWTEISRRHERGESYRRILTDMNLLKR